MSLKKGLLFFLIPISLIALAVLIYFSAFSKLIVIQDKTWASVLPKGSFFELRTKLLKHGYRLKVVTLDESILTESQALMAEFKKLDTDVNILVCPIITSVITTKKINIKDEMVNARIFGIGKEKSGDYFDVVFVSNENTGWKKALEKVEASNEKYAVLYDNSSISEAEFLYNSSKSNSVLKINKDDYGKLYVFEISSQLEALDLKLIICPHINEMNEVSSQLETYSWITDYRFAGAVTDNLIGTVCPDIYSSMKKYLSHSLTPQESGLDILMYEYREAGRKIF